MFGNGSTERQLDPQRALLAALPPVIFALGILLHALLASLPSSSARWYTIPTWSLVAGVGGGLISAVVLFVGALVAIMRGLPDWGYTWAGAGFATLALGLNVLAEEWAERGLPLVSPAVEVALLGLLLLAGGILIGWAALRGWPQAGLVSIGISSMMILSLCAMATNAPFYRWDLALLAGPLGLLIALLTYFYVRRPGAIRFAAILAVGLTSAAVAVVVNQAWQSWLTTRGRPSLLLPFLILLTGALMAGPVFGVSAQLLRRAIDKG